MSNVTNIVLQTFSMEKNVEKINSYFESLGFPKLEHLDLQDLAIGGGNRQMEVDLYLGGYNRFDDHLEGMIGLFKELDWDAEETVLIVTTQEGRTRVYQPNL